MSAEAAPLLSVVTPTFRRKDLLRRCVESVLSQKWDGTLEYTVVNDAGDALSPADWMSDPRVRVVTTFQTEKCVARNTGAALSRGTWVMFLDDDDYLLPGALAAMGTVAQNTEAALVYGGYRTENGTTGENITHQPAVQGFIPFKVLAGEFVPLQAAWFKRTAFFAVGGFDPAFLATEDVDMVRRIGLIGAVAGTSHVCAVIRIAHPLTTNSRHDLSAQFWSRGTDKCIELPGTFALAQTHTRGLPYWRGRCAREYAGSAGRALRSGRVLTALSRTTAATRLALLYGLRPAFMRGLRRLPEG